MNWCGWGINHFPVSYLNQGLLKDPNMMVYQLNPIWLLRDDDDDYDDDDGDEDYSKNLHPHRCVYTPFPFPSS